MPTRQCPGLSLSWFVVFRGANTSTALSNRLVSCFINLVCIRHGRSDIYVCSFPTIIAYTHTFSIRLEHGRYLENGWVGSSGITSNADRSYHDDIRPVVLGLLCCPNQTFVRYRHRAVFVYYSPPFSKIINYVIKITPEHRVNLCISLSLFRRSENL